VSPASPPPGYLLKGQAENQVLVESWVVLGIRESFNESQPKLYQYFILMMMMIIIIIMMIIIIIIIIIS